MKENIKKATRESFGMALAELAGQYPQMVVLDADLAKATRTDLLRQSVQKDLWTAALPRRI